jgi:hypothetical protein
MGWIRRSSTIRRPQATVRAASHGGERQVVHHRRVPPFSKSLRRLVVGGGLAASTFLTLRCLAEVPVTFSSPHVVDGAPSTLDAPFARALDAEIEATEIHSIDDLLHFALERTDANLHFGLDHRTTLAFGTKEREGNCVEYAHLFATLFNGGALRKKVAARAYVVRSDARILGLRIPDPAFVDHDWVLIVPDAPGEARRFVDPTLADVGLDWDISANVLDEVKIAPRRRPPAGRSPVLARPVKTSI